MATKNKKPFNIYGMAAQIIGRFPHQFKMEATRDTYIYDCKLTLEELNPAELKIAYDRTLKTWRGAWAPRPAEILDNAPVPFVANKDFMYDRDLRAYVKDNRDHIESRFRQAFLKDIQKARDNGWIFIDDLVNHLVFVQAWYDFEKKPLDIHTEQGRLLASQCNSIVGSRNPGRSGDDTLMRWTKKKARRVTPERKAGPP